MYCTRKFKSIEETRSITLVRVGHLKKTRKELVRSADSNFTAHLRVMLICNKIFTG